MANTYSNESIENKYNKVNYNGVKNIIFNNKIYFLYFKQLNYKK